MKNVVTCSTKIMTTSGEAIPKTKPFRSQICLDVKESLYVVIDACQAPELISMSRHNLSQQTRMLFKGIAASLPEVETFAPFFIPVDLRSNFLENWSTYAGKNAGILFASSAEPRIVFRHLRNIFIVKDEAGQEHFFRFYDPRVARAFIPSCTEVEVVEFFGPITTFWIDSEMPHVVERWSHSHGRPYLESFPITPTSPL